MVFPPVFIIYLAIIVENVVLIVIVCVDKSLHEPMYILMCNLAVNSLYGGTALLPALLTNLLSRSKEISLALCQTQLYAIHTYAITEFTILAAMSYDKYLAICFPLAYHAIMSKRIFKVVALMWLYPLVAFFLVFAITLRLKFCKKTIDKVYCLNYLLVQLSCSDTSAANIVGLLSVALYTGPQIAMVLFAYAQILKICLKSFHKSKLTLHKIIGLSEDKIL
ncbi:hypothetical protein WMY93_007876 [Mugilogobius chulae]|uniref:G-protein coupled receptors family 1 profile domain-containing protein n=1 Tax=Mugilogobius chulae TaxID=88201 RepID=A0AAW0PFJ9_9GOBI